MMDLTDDEVLDLTRLYLVTSFLYYKCDYDLVPDTVYDIWCKTLLENHDRVPDKYTPIIEKDQLAAGTGFAINWKAVWELDPAVITFALEQLPDEADDATP